jgi:molybdopterin-guanine dinucleotide biosynthesis protein A
MKLLGAVIAGGTSSRFGSDKAVAMVDDLPLIDHVVMGLFRATENLVICGRDWRDFDVVMDGDFAGQGPLAGLLAALLHAHETGFDGVISAACDALPVPDLNLLIGDGPAVIEGHWLFGYWPVGVVTQLSVHLSSQPDRSVRGWIAACNARQIPVTENTYNLNTRDDILAYEQSLEMSA